MAQKRRVLKDARKGFLQLMCVSGQLNRKKFMLLVTETNHGLAYDKDVKVSFETFYDVIFVAMVTKTLLKHTPQKSFFLKYISKINSVTYIFLKLFLKECNILHFLCKFEKIL